MTTGREELLDLARAARTFLEPVWRQWHAADGGIVPAILSQGVCGRSSLFLREVLRSEGFSADWKSGAGDCGYLHGEAWRGHAWVVTGNRIVDITADQFGQPPVAMTTADDRRYRAGADRADPEAVLRRGEAVAAIWSDWSSFRNAGFRQTARAPSPPPGR